MPYREDYLATFLSNLLMDIRYSDGMIKPILRVNMPFDEFVRKNYNERDQNIDFKTFCDYPITKFDDHFIIGE
jgi:hypothetical protein